MEPAPLERTNQATRSVESVTATGAAGARASQLRGLDMSAQMAALDPNQQPGFAAQSGQVTPGQAGTASGAVALLSASKASKAVSFYPQASWPKERVAMVGRTIGLPSASTIDTAFVQAAATWQQSRGLAVDGMLGGKSLGLLLGNAATEDDHARASALTGKYESNGDWCAVQTADNGIVSYGIHQCTLASGSLGKVIDNYASKAPESPNARQLRGYSSKYNSGDAKVKEPLRNDGKFISLLKTAGCEDAMHDAQNEVFESEYWKPAVGIATSCGLQTSLGYAAIYDCTIQSGPSGCSEIANNTIRALGGMAGGVGSQGKTISEQDFIIAFNQARNNRLDAIIRKNLAEGTSSGAKNAAMLEKAKNNRVATMTMLAEQGNLGLQGDAEGHLGILFNDGRSQVHMPEGVGSTGPRNAPGSRPSAAPAAAPRVSAAPAGGAQAGAQAAPSRAQSSPPPQAKQPQSLLGWGLETSSNLVRSGLGLLTGG